MGLFVCVNVLYIPAKDPAMIRSMMWLYNMFAQSNVDKIRLKKKFFVQSSFTVFCPDKTCAELGYLQCRNVFNHSQNSEWVKVERNIATFKEHGTDF